MSGRSPAAAWRRHAREWRDPAQICSQWRDASNVDPRLLQTRISGDWWAILASLRITLLVTREYEHLIVAASMGSGRPRLSFLPMPHPSGLVVDRARHRVFVASTRNPNQVFALKPATLAPGGWLAPVSSTFFPGSLRLHDLAIVGEELYGNAVGQNAVVRLLRDGGFRRVWWPRCIEQAGGAAFDDNYIQLNSIAPGRTIRDSYFSASSSSVGRIRPGHLNYPVDGRGVVFSGRTREPICEGLTRPHSARTHRGRLWVANSGYGQLGVVSGGRFQPLAQLPGWTRGLCLVRDVAFVATSRVIPRYAAYAPGLDVARSRCAIHAVSLTSGSVLGSLEWPSGNQVFAIDWMKDGQTTGFPFDARRRRTRRETDFFYTSNA